MRYVRGKGEGGKEREDKTRGKGRGDEGACAKREDGMIDFNIIVTEGQRRKKVLGEHQ